eukprot:Anaeramoba_ignava/a353376_7.p1 GENE.a353376_7~~a353376_7.p1  ORF type:complete len:122 (+),score=17.11 a353376_7:843-1208(+)
MLIIKDSRSFVSSSLNCSPAFFFFNNSLFILEFWVLILKYSLSFASISSLVLTSVVSIISFFSSLSSSVRINFPKRDEISSIKKIIESVSGNFDHCFNFSITVLLTILQDAAFQSEIEVNA